MCVHGRVLLLLLFLECFGVRTPLYDKKIMDFKYIKSILLIHSWHWKSKAETMIFLLYLFKVYAESNILMFTFLS